MKAVVLLSKVFFDGHTHAGQPTNFAQSVKCGNKTHTVRSNYPYWKKKIAALREQGGSLCIRQWEDKPYRSKQEAILEVPATIVDVQKVVITQSSINSLLPVNVDGREVPISEIAKNDGLSSTDFVEFFKPILKASGGRRTHFRYNSLYNFQILSHEGKTNMLLLHSFCEAIRRIHGRQREGREIYLLLH